MKRIFKAVAASAAVIMSLGVGSADAAPITLSTGFGGADTEIVSGVTLGSSITFDYMFQSVTYGGGAWPGINASVINPLLGPFPVGQFNDWRNAVTGWLTASINTTSGIGSIHDLAFTANTFGATGNAVVVLIRNVAIDGRIIAASVPEPATLVLLLIGLAGAAGALGRPRTAE